MRRSAVITTIFFFCVSCTEAPQLPRAEPNDVTDDALAGDEGADGSADDDAPDRPGSSGSTAAPRPDPFAGAPAYASEPAIVRASVKHTDAKVTVVPNKDAKCVSCHTGAGATKFLLGGSAYQDRAAATPAKDVEVGLIDAAGTTVFVHSDEDGNFWVPAAQAGAVVFPAYVSVRMDAMTKPMKRKLSAAADLECHSCHGTANPIVRP